jgi:BlaI family penicillinase repressor
VKEKKMEYVKLCDSDYRFMCVVWEHAPINSGELVKLCQEQLGWKKSTTYTVVRKMCEKGYIANEDATVSVLIPKEQVQAEESRYFVDRTFDGSLPGFITAFLGGKKISKKEAKMLKKMKLTDL